MRDNILKYTIAIALLIAALSNAQYKVDPRLEPYVKEYFDLLDTNNIEYNTPTMLISVSQPLKGTEYLGVAKGMNNDDIVYITISPKFFRLSIYAKRWVMYHELSHDIFNLRHGSIKLMSKTAPSYVDTNMLSSASKELIGYLKGL